MTTEMSPSSRNLSWAQPLGGLPLDNGLYKQTSDQKFHYGSRIIHPIDGSVYRYCLGRTALYSGFGAFNYTTASYIIGAVLPAAIAIGTKRNIAVTVASGDGYAGDGVVAKDELVGGYVVMGHGETLVQKRLIIANTAVATGGGTCYIDVDGAIEQTMTISSSYCEIQLNQYGNTGRSGDDNYLSVVCVPNTNVTSTYSYWGQTKGACWITPGGADAYPGNTVNDRNVYFVGDGSVNAGTYIAASESGKSYQRAGYIIDATASGTGAMPLVMLDLESSD